jgi:hypothetical protein
MESSTWIGATDSGYCAVLCRAQFAYRRDHARPANWRTALGKPFTNIWPGQKDLLTYYVGIFNGNGRNVSVNDNNNFMYVGRLESTLFKSKLWGESYLKLGADILNSRDDKGTNISQSLNLLVNDDGSLSPFVLPGADEKDGLEC